MNTSSHKQILALPLLTIFLFSCDLFQNYEKETDWWEDPETGLIWQETPSEEPFSTRRKAANHCEELDLLWGDWRLPSIDELRSLVRRCPYTDVEGPCPASVTIPQYMTTSYEYCHGLYWDCPSSGCNAQDPIREHCGAYWSSTAVPDEFDTWIIDFDDGVIRFDYDDDYLAICVRGPEYIIEDGNYTTMCERMRLLDDSIVCCPEENLRPFMCSDTVWYGVDQFTGCCSPNLDYAVWCNGTDTSDLEDDTCTNEHGASGMCISTTDTFGFHMDCSWSL